MKFKILFLSLLSFICLHYSYGQDSAFKLSVNVTVENEEHEDFKESGRMFLFLTHNTQGEPYTQTFPFPGARTFIFAKNISDFNKEQQLELNYDKTWISTVDWTFDEVPEGEYYIQVLWDQDRQESRINAPGNIYSEKQKIKINKNLTADLELSEKIEPTKVIEHDLSREINFKSELLTKFWNKPMSVKASILLPHNYDPKKAYAIRYNVAGYGGRYYRINRLLSRKDFMSWWDSEEAPQIITIFLDGEGPFGDSYQMDSDNSGPYGEMLTTELIPYIEKEFRGTNSAENRFVDGCSTGGWVSLGLQIYYPDVFSGCFSYSPDAVEFENYQLIDIYEDKNAYKNEFGYDRPVMRMPDGEPVLMLKEFLQYENVLGSSNTYLNSGGQFSAHAALYSPKGEDGLPKPLFDPATGDIDHEVAEHWKKYDFKIYLKENWAELGPKLAGKIYVWMGDMDHFYLNQATRELADYLETTEQPKSDAVIEFAPYQGHCDIYGHKTVLLQIQDKIDGNK